ncbi:MAG: lipid-transfer protein [Actinobacteria bacterium]|nr:lipid-transfer protein [Actinomycetota bacterium]
MTRAVYVAGVGMTKFEKPGTSAWDYPDMVRVASERALEDAGVRYTDVEAVHVGYVYGPSTAGQRAIYELGHTGVPITNVNNNCATGSTALWLARQAVAGGLVDVALAVGFEKMQRGSLSLDAHDRASPLDRHVSRLHELHDPTDAPMAPQMWARAADDHMRRYGTTVEQFAMVAEKNHRHSANNPYAQFQDVYTLEQILTAPMVDAPLTRLQCSPTSDGSAAAVLMSEDALSRFDCDDRAVHIAGQGMATDLASSYEGDAIKVVGADLSATAARRAYEQAGFDVLDAQVIELHDCFSPNEIITYEALGLCGEGEGGKLIEAGETSYGGRWVVNPSGGLISKGHPLGATGLAQCAELTWQLRGEAEARQVDGATRAVQHNIGLGGAAVVTLYEKV